MRKAYIPGRVYRRALRLVNVVRRAKGRAPIDALPSGYPAHAGCCPLARALDNAGVRQPSVYAESIYYADDMSAEWRAAPRSVRDFVRAFDGACFARGTEHAPLPDDDLGEGRFQGKEGT